jgi:hypothetical protein
MKPTGTNNIAIIILLTLLITVVSCKKDEAGMPEISDLELGYDNTKKVKAGSELHIDAEIVAPNGIDIIVIDIHFEDDHLKSTTIAENEHEEWVVNISYDKFRGLKNTKVHEDMHVPANAEPGRYHFSLKVIDMEGYTAEVEEYIEVLEPETE